MATAEEVGAIARTLPRTIERVVRDRLTYRVGKLVYATISADDTVLGVAFPREERAALVAGDPVRFGLPRESDLRFHWVHVNLAAVAADEVRELVVDGWRMVVPKRVAAAYDAEPGSSAHQA